MTDNDKEFMATLVFILIVIMGTFTLLLTSQIEDAGNQIIQTIKETK